jgi:hypothetical protein
MEKKLIEKLLRNHSRGQAIILVALAFVGVVAMIGLAMDGGVLLINYATLKRSVDAASIAAAQQFRKNYNPDDMTNAVSEFLQLNKTQLNQSPITNIITETCATALTPGDPALCTDPPRKLVRVTATQHVNFGFLRVLGIDSTDITSSSIGEAASIDMMLVIDTSISMAAATDYEDHDYGNGSCPSEGNPPAIDPKCQNDVNADDDPSICNNSAADPCQPMTDVLTEAKQFADLMFYPYDRVGVVALTDQVPGDTTTAGRNPKVIWDLQSGYVNGGDINAAGVTDQANVDNAINGSGVGGNNGLSGLKVYQPTTCKYNADNSTFAPIDTPHANPDDNVYGPCLNYPPAAPNNGAFAGQECPAYRLSNPNDPTTCNNTNGGGGLEAAGAEFTFSPTVAVRKDSLWIVVALLTGAPNSSWPLHGDLGNPNYDPNGYCPSSNWGAPLCIQTGMTVSLTDPTRHSSPWDGPAVANYTPLDYARDMADWVSSPASENGQNASIFGICLGHRCRNSTAPADATEPEEFLEYASETAGGTSANHGNYYYSETVGDLTGIFQDIYNSITTRIAQ